MDSRKKISISYEKISDYLVLMLRDVIRELKSSVLLSDASVKEISDYIRPIIIKYALKIYGVI